MTGQDFSGARLIVGLGNPGSQYQNTRHNLGFMVLEQMARAEQLRFELSSLCKGLIAEGRTEVRDFFLLLPLTFMNLSGVAVKQLASQKKFAVQDILVVTDDYNLPFGQLRLRRQGSAGGHNGLASVSEHLSSDDFPRLRVGVGAPPVKNQNIDFVLSEFTKEESARLGDIVKAAADCCAEWIDGEIDDVMGRFNRTDL